VGSAAPIPKIGLAYRVGSAEGAADDRSDISFAVWLTNTDSTAPSGRIILRIYARVKTPAESCHPFGISPYGVATYPSEKANKRKPFLP
jgi:hypothetical protein